MRGIRCGSPMMRGVRAGTPLMRFLLRCGRVRTVLDLICSTDGETVSLMLRARPYLLDGTVMVAETPALICLVHQLLAPVFPSFVSCGLRPFDCLMRIVLMGVVRSRTPIRFDWVTVRWWCSDGCCVLLMRPKAIRSSLLVVPLCHRQIFGRETPNDLTAKSSAIEMKRGLQVL
jgi:hypothetical protein